MLPPGQSKMPSRIRRPRQNKTGRTDTAERGGTKGCAKIGRRGEAGNKKGTPGVQVSLCIL